MLQYQKNMSYKKRIFRELSSSLNVYETSLRYVNKQASDELYNMFG